MSSQRLALALEDLGAPGSTGPEIRTNAGRLILRTETAAGDDHDMLVRASVRLPVDRGIVVRVAAIEDLVRIRVATGTPEDLASAIVLRAVADEVALWPDTWRSQPLGP